MKKVLSIFALLILCAFMNTTGSLHAQASKYKVVGKIDIGGEAKWDYLSIDYTMHRLYVSHGSSVNVIDLKNNTLIGEIKDLHGVHGIAYAPEFGKGFVTEGGANAVTVFDLKTLKVIEVIKLDAKKPDAIMYDLFSKRIFAFCGGSNNAAAIDAKSDSIVGYVKLDGGPEFACSDEKGKIYVNIEDKNEIVLFNSKSLATIALSPLTPCETPTGMAIDKQNRRIYCGGRNKLLAVVEANSGKVIKTLPIGAGVDACAYDPDNRFVFASCKDGTITVIKQESPDKYSVIDNVKTEEGAKTMALDLTTHKIYTSTMISTTGKTKDGKSQKSFGVLILDNK